MSIHRGKIGRLSPELREQVNLRLERGKRGAPIIAWLNSHPDVRAMLKEEFEGKPIRKQNLSEWRSHGFKDWLRRREAQRMAAEIGELPAAANSPLTNQLAAWGSIRYLMAVRDLVQNHADGSSHFNTMREFHRDIIALRHLWAHLDTVLVAQPSRLRVPAASRCEDTPFGWIRAAGRRPNSQARTPALQFRRATPRTVSKCPPSPLRACILCGLIVIPPVSCETGLL